MLQNQKDESFWSVSMIIEGIFNIDIQDQHKHPLDLYQINLLVHHHLTPAVSSLLVQFTGNHSIQILNTKTGADSYFYLLVLLLTVYENMLGY